MKYAIIAIVLALAGCSDNDPPPPAGEPGRTFEAEDPPYPREPEAPEANG